MDASHGKELTVTVIGCLLTAALSFGCLQRCCAADAADELPSIDATLTFDEPPQWAVLERQLIDRMNASVDVFVQKYLKDDGWFRYDCWGKLDDSYEPFHNWPTFYVLGGDNRFLRLGKRQWEVVTRRFAEEGVVKDEFHRCDDWFHLGEGLHLFYTLCLADPRDARFAQRARRFAGFYLNEGGVRNYDPRHNIILAPRTGSAGPLPWDPDKPPQWFFATDHYGVPFYDIPGITSFDDVKKDQELYKKMALAVHQRHSRGDVPANLAVTSLVLNAYMLTGSQRYADWIKTYVDGWMRRTEENGGILPDNVGLSGKVGEYTGGRWYGGLYGWTFPHGWGNLAQEVGMAAENALLLTGDMAHLTLFRSQLDLLISLAIPRNNTLYAPSKHGEPNRVHNTPFSWLPVLRKGGGIRDGEALEVDGWFKFEPMDPVGPAHLWNASMDPKDLERAKKLRNHDPEARWSNDWTNVQSISRFASKDHGGHEAAWMAYLDGTYPAYPVEILKYNISQVNGRVNTIREHKPKEGDRFGLIYRNPVSVEGLVNLTMGGPLPFYNGGLLMVRVRHFDPANKRPGLPPDVAALVSTLEADRTVLHLVNLSRAQPRDVIVQAGAYAEHQFLEAKYQAGPNADARDTVLAVNASRMKVHLPPRSMITLDIATKRFANKPSYALPW